MVSTEKFLRIFVIGLFAIFISYSCQSIEAEKPYSQFFSFETARTVVKPLLPKELSRAKELDASDSSFVDIMSDKILYTGEMVVTPIAQVLEAQERDLHDIGSIEDLKNKLQPDSSSFNTGYLYYGVFHKLNNDLVGVIDISRVRPCNLGSDGFPRKHSLDLSIKYHKQYQGQGFATEVTIGLFEHFQRNNLIPRIERDIESSLFAGFEGLIELKNKASLKCALKSGWRIVRMFGARVEVVYPFVVPASVEYESYMPAYDKALHDQVKGAFDRYLSRERVAIEAELELRQICLQNLMNVKESFFAQVIQGDRDFIMDAMLNFPQLFESFQRGDFARKFQIIHQVISSLRKQSLEEVSKSFLHQSE